MGWTKGKPRKPKAKVDTEPAVQQQPQEQQPQEKRGLSWRAKMKAESAEWRDEASDNLFSLSQASHDWLADHGLVPQWNVETVCGQPIESLLPTGDQRRYWEAVQPGDIPGLDNVERGGCRLYVRPKQLHDTAEEHHQREARSRLKNHEAALLGGDLRGVPADAARHISATRTNRVAHSFGPIKVPTE